MSWATRSPTRRPSAVGWPGETETARPLERISRTTWCVEGTGVLPTVTSGAATRVPEASTVQTASPTRRSSTAISPVGVAMRVPRARQIGHGGGPLGVRLAIVIAPHWSIVPSTRLPCWEFGALENMARKWKPALTRSKRGAVSIFQLLLIASYCFLEEVAVGAMLRLGR